MAKPSLKNFKHICIIQTAFLGDVALALPLVQIIRNYHPDVKITFLSTPAAGGITSCIPAIDTILTYDKRGIRKGFDGIKHMASIIKELNVDCILSCHRSFRTSFLVAMIHPAYSVGFDISSLSFLISKRVKYVKHLHEIERNLELLTAFDDYPLIEKKIDDVKLDISYDDKTFVESMLMQKKISQDKLISIFPGSVWETKRWKKEHFIRLVHDLNDSGYICILNGSETDKTLCDSIAAETNSFSLAGNLTLSQTICLISLSRLIVTNDSAPTHFAFLAETPAVTIYGPTSPIFGFAPRSKNSISTGLEDLKCRPCEIHGGRVCPINTHECMLNLTPRMVMDSCRQILNT